MPSFKTTLTIESRLFLAEACQIYFYACMAKMHAVVIHRYGGPDENKYTEIPKPQVRRGQLLVKVHYAAINPVDWKTRSGKNKFVPMGGSFPKVLGHDFAGEVVALGQGVKDFAVGDPVFAMQGLTAGAYAEYIAVAAGICAKKPNNISFEEAAAVPLAGLTALQALRNVGNIKAGQTVVINGASGGVGIYAVQLAKHFGAKVYATCSKPSFDMVKALGADECINYREVDFTQAVNGVHIVFDCVGNRSFAECSRMMTKDGVYINTNTQPLQLVTSLVSNVLRSQKDKQVLAIPNRKDMEFLVGLLHTGTLKAIIDRSFPLADVQAAHEYSESGRAKGKITIDMGVGK